MNKVSAFHNSCLRKLICNIYWPNKISKENLYQITRCMSMDLEITKRQLRWLGHVLRMPQDRIPKVALRWTPPGERKHGRPKTIWRKTVEMKLIWIDMGGGHNDWQTGRGEIPSRPHAPLGAQGTEESLKTLVQNN